MAPTTFDISRAAGTALAIGCLVLGATSARAQLSDDERAALRCEHVLYEAAAQYASCQLKATGAEAGSKPAKARARARACVVGYAAEGAGINKRFGGTDTPCAAARFVNNGATVTDNLTGLQWERKTDDSGVHDKDNRYTWNALSGDDFTAADGTLFTSFLPSLNGSGCFAGHCDWRLPTLAELQTVLRTDCAPENDPCIDGIFGPTATVPDPPDNSYFYWSATAVHNAPGAIWIVLFDSPYGPATGVSYGDGPVRAVRGGL